MEQPVTNDSAVAARIALLIEQERRESEERLARRKRRVLVASLVGLVPLVLWGLVVMLQYLL